jgi:uncharacterized cupredoxin-like copper-binding protein
MQTQLPIFVLAAGLAATLASSPQFAAGATTDASAVDWSKAQLVTVIAVEYEFKPNHLTFHRGAAYRLHLDNRGAEMHELTAPEFFHASLIKNPDVLARDGTDLVVEPHESKDVLLVPQQAGQFRMFCADHDWAGMTGDITVE